MKFPVFIIFSSIFLISSLCSAQEDSINQSKLAHSASLEILTQEISDNVMSPFCPGLTLSSCPSPQAKDLRVEIHSWLEQGYSKEAAINKLKIIYGEKISGLPQTSSTWGRISSLMPFIFLLLGIVVLLYTLKNMKKQ